MEQKTPEDYYEMIQKINNVFISDGNNVDNYQKYYNELKEINTKVQNEIEQIVNNEDKKEEKLYNDYRAIFKINYLTNWCLVIGILILIKFMFDSVINISTNK